MELTTHVFQRLGAHAAACLAGQEHPGLLAPADLPQIHAQVITDAVRSALAARGEPGWAWHQRMIICYPNSPVTHPARVKWGADGIRDRLEAAFAPDDAPEGPCHWCGQPAAQRWAKPMWPLADSGRYVNTQPAGGRLTCQDCRTAVWCMPYAAGYSYGRMRTWSSTDEFEAAVARRMTARARDTVARAETAPPDGLGAAVINALLAGADRDLPDTEFQIWSNDNRNPEISKATLTARNAAWLKQVYADSQARDTFSRLLDGRDPVNYLLTDRGYPDGRVVRDTARIAREYAADGVIAPLPLLKLAVSWAACEA